MNILFIPIILYIYIHTHTHVNLEYNNKIKKNIHHYTYFIWEQTYHNKVFNSYLNIFYLGTNISQQSIKFFIKKKTLNSYLNTFLYVLFGSKHIATKH